MRRLTLILCLLFVAALHWIVRPIKPFTDAAPNDACGPTSYVAPEARNKGLRASVSATVMSRTADLGSAVHRSHLMATIASSDSLAAIALVMGTTGEFENRRVQLRQGAQNLSPASDRMWSGRMLPL